MHFNSKVEILNSDPVYKFSSWLLSKTFNIYSVTDIINKKHELKRKIRIERSIVKERYIDYVRQTDGDSEILRKITYAKFPLLFDHITYHGKQFLVAKKYDKVRFYDFHFETFVKFILTQKSEFFQYFFQHMLFQTNLSLEKEQFEEI